MIQLESLGERNPNEDLQDPISDQTQTNQQESDAPVAQAKLTIKELGRKLKDAYPGTVDTLGPYDAEDDETLGRLLIKKYPVYGKQVDMSSLLYQINAETVPNVKKVSTFDRQFQESLQPTSGKVRKGIPTLERKADASQGVILPLDTFKHLDPAKSNDVEYADAVTQATWGVGIAEIQELYSNAGLELEDFAPVGKSAKENAAYAKLHPEHKIIVAQNPSTQRLRAALAQGGEAGFYAMAEHLKAEQESINKTLHDVTPEEREKVLATRRAVSFKLGMAQATIGQNEFWTNLLSLASPLGAGARGPNAPNLVQTLGSVGAFIGGQGWIDPKGPQAQLTTAAPQLPEFYKNQSNFDAFVEIVPGTITNTARMLAMASLGSAVGQVSNVGPVIGSILGIQADAGVQHLDKPLSEQATHQLITLAMSGAGVGAGIARNTLAARGIFVPNIVYIPTESMAMGLGTLGSMEILTPEATFQQKLANSLVGALMPLGFAAARGLTPKTRPRVVPEPTKEPLQLTAGIGDLRLPETFPIYEGKFADKYTVNLSRPGEEAIQLPYQPGEQIPLFDAVIGGNKARVQIGKTLQGLNEEGLADAFEMAGGMKENLPTDRNQLITAIMDLHSSKFPLMEATTNNAAVEAWMGITKTQQHLETPFHFGKEYRLLEDAPKYYKVQDVDNTNTIFRIAKLSPGGLTAEIFPVEMSLSEKRFRIPDFQGQNAVTQPILFPEPQTGKATSTLGQPATMEVGRDSAIARLRLLRDFAKTPEYKQLSPEGKKQVKTELGQLRKEISTPVERNQIFVSKEEASRHKENLTKFTERPEFKELDAQYQELVRREVSDLNFLLTGNKGTPEDIARQEQIYRPPSGKIPVNIPTNFIEKAVVETIADIELAKQQTPSSKPPAYDAPPVDSPLWRAIDKAPTETLADVVKRSGGDPTTLSRPSLELRAFDALGGKRVVAGPDEPSFITSARTRLNEDSLAGGMVLTSQMFDQALVYAYDNIYKPGMKFLDFSERMLEKFGDEVGPRIHDLWDQVMTAPRKPKGLTEQYIGADKDYGGLLSQVPKGVEPKPVGNAEVIVLARDTDAVMLDPAIPKAALDPETRLYPEDWTRGVDTTPEQVAAHVSEITANKRIVSKETRDAALAELRGPGGLLNLNQTNALIGVTPRQLRAMSVAMAYEMENGIYNFGKAFSEKAVQLFGDAAKVNMTELGNDTARYIRLFRQSPVLNKISQLGSGIPSEKGKFYPAYELGKVLNTGHKIAFGGVDFFRWMFGRGARSAEAREIGDVWASGHANVSRKVDTMKTQLQIVHDWAEGFVYYTGKGSRLNLLTNYAKSELNTKDLRLEMNFALDEGKETALLNHLNVPSDIKVLINEMRTVLADMRNEIRQISPNALEEVVDNYFPRLWKKMGSDHEAVAGSKTGAPFTGSKDFLKQRHIDSTRDGVTRLGKELASDNFVDNFIVRYEEMQKFIEMNKVLKYMKDRKMEHVIDRADLESAKEFYRPLNDKVSSINNRIEKANGEVTYEDSGKVKVYPAMVADLINGHLAPSLHRFAAFRSWNGFANFANQFQLVGYFHLALVAADATFRLPAIAVKGAFDSAQHKYHGESQAAMGALRESAKALASFVTTGGIGGVMYHGHKMLKEWDTSGSVGGKYTKRVQFAQLGGAQARMEGHFQTKAIEGTIKNIRNIAEILASEDPEVNKVFGTAKQVAAGVSKIPFAAIEVVMRPMLEAFVPRAKMGIQYYMQGYEMSRMGSRANAKDVRRTSAKIETVISDTLGQMNYGNLHMNKAVKEVLMSTVRATGFQMGAQRTAYMPLLDTVNFGKDLVTPGARAEFTHRMAYMIGIGIGLPLMHGIAQMLTTAVTTGKPTWLGEDKEGKFDPSLATKDAVAFRTGRLDQNGDPERFYIPNLGTKEIYPVFGRALEGRFDAAAEHQMTILGHKLNPGVALLGDLKHNKDFYGRYIFDPNDDKGVIGEAGDYAISQLTPFFLKNREILEQRGITGLARFTTFFGPTPAPQYINASTAEDVMAGILNDRYSKAGRPIAEYERGILKRKYMNQWRQATLLGDEALQNQVDEALDADIKLGKLTNADRKTIRKGVDRSRTKELFERLIQPNADGIQNGLRVYEKWMSPEERAIVFSTLREQRKRILKLALSPEAKAKLLNDFDAIIDRDSKLHPDPADQDLDDEVILPEEIR